ncbi:hypothetical protein [Paludisphaera mucosa]|uniref:Response regulatory domain-containing protein n=1 Tax=Paludisphaera mucosa TaxID=3030827 RepID=A0ABT6F883_9BACT|nr:hypothetical protein [Paludisphaera mucosa]MDG3003580.1 hypothetical protein [Paludisphaera mucosa]
MSRTPTIRDLEPPPVVVLHERSGAWARQLRPRFQREPVRWFETRSTADLLAAISAATTPIIVIEAGPDPIPALRDLAAVLARGSSPLVLLLDAEGRPEVAAVARELGASLAEPGRATPPQVAAWLARWLALAAKAIRAEGWSRPSPADPAREPTAWIEEQIAAAARIEPESDEDFPPARES